MNEEEKKVVGDYKSKLDLYKYEKKIGLGRINIDEKIYEMEVIINVIERLQKENEEYSKQLDLDYVDKNYISKKKIEDTIEELKVKLEDISRRREKSKTKEEETVLWCLEIRIDERIKTLQELLENYKMDPKQ